MIYIDIAFCCGYDNFFGAITVQIVYCGIVHILSVTSNGFRSQIYGPSAGLRSSGNIINVYCVFQDGYNLNSAVIINVVNCEACAKIFPIYCFSDILQNGSVTIENSDEGVVNVLHALYENFVFPVAVDISEYRIRNNIGKSNRESGKLSPAKIPYMQRG